MYLERFLNLFFQQTMLLYFLNTGTLKTTRGLFFVQKRFLGKEDTVKWILIDEDCVPELYTQGA